MKHPALTQALSIVLLMLSLTMAAAGVLGLRSAASERQAVLESMDRLRRRAEEYRRLADFAEGTVSFAEQNEALEARQTQHDKDSSRHRAELGTYTATKYGINMGTEAIDRADEQFAWVSAQFNSALPAVEDGLAQLGSLLDSLWTLYNAADGAVQHADAHLNTARSFAACLDSGEELTAAQAVAAYDELLTIADELTAMRTTLQEIRAALDTIAAFDPASVEAMTGQVEKLMTSLGDFGAVPVESYQDFDVTVPYDLGELSRMQGIFAQYWNRAQGLLDALDTYGPLIGQQLEEATGLSVESLRADAQSERDALAARGDEPLSPEESAVIRAVYEQNSAGIHAGLERAESELAPIQASLAELGAALGSAQETLDGFSAMLTMAKNGIQEGAIALFQARAMIWWQMGQQREKEEALRREKAELEQESEALEKLGGEAEEQRDLESRLRSARAALMNRDEVSALAVNGREPDEAALVYAAKREGSAALEYDRRQRACVLMLAAALGGLAALPGAFSARGKRRLVLPPVLLCLGCALGAEWIFRDMGRGDSYSCLGAASFALLQVLVTLPGKKKRTRISA